MSKRKYKKGKMISCIADFGFSPREWFIWNGKTTHRSVLESLQYRTLLYSIKQGGVFEAERIENGNDKSAINPDRRYFAISIKHTEYRWKFGMPCTLWGWHCTEDDEIRCFAGYTIYPEKAERYAIGEMRKHGYGTEIKDDEAVPMSIDLCKKWKDYDTVLVEAEQYFAYCKMSGLATSPTKEDA